MMAGRERLPSVVSPWGSGKDVYESKTTVQSTSPHREDKPQLRQPPKTSLGFHSDKAAVGIRTKRNPQNSQERSRPRTSMYWAGSVERSPTFRQIVITNEDGRRSLGRRQGPQKESLSEKPVLDLARQIETRLRTEIQVAKKLLLEEREHGIAIERKIQQILPMANRAQELLGMLPGPDEGRQQKVESMVIAEEAEEDNEETGWHEQLADGAVQARRIEEISGTSSACEESRQRESHSPSGTKQASVVDGSPARNTTKSHRQSNSDQPATRGDSGADAGNAKHTPPQAQSYAAQTARRQQRLMQGITSNSPTLESRSTRSPTRDAEENMAAETGGKGRGTGSSGHVMSTSDDHAGRAEVEKGKVSSWSSEAATWRLEERWSKGTAWWEHRHAASHVEETCDVSPGLLRQVQHKIAHSLSQLRDAAAVVDRAGKEVGEKPEGGDEEAVSDIVKLEVYMEGFDELLSGFKVYRPLLARIKQAMDLCIRDYREALEAASGNKIAAVARKKAELELLKKTTYDTTNSLTDARTSLSQLVGEGEARIQTLEDKNAHQRFLANTRAIQNVRTQETQHSAMQTNDELFIQRKELTDLRSASELTHFKVRRCEKKIAKMRLAADELQGEEEMLSATLGKIRSENEERRLNADIQCANLTHLNVTVDDLLWAWRESGHRGSFARLWEQAQAQSRRREAQKASFRTVQATPHDKAKSFQAKQREMRAEKKAALQIKKAELQKGLSRSDLLQAEDWTAEGLGALVESGEGVVETEPAGGHNRADMGSMLAPCAACGEVVQEDEETVRQGPGRYIHRHCADKTFSSFKSNALQAALQSQSNLLSVQFK